HAQAIKSNRVVRLQPRSTLGIHFRIGETFRVHRADTWLDQDETERDQGIRIRGSKLNRLSISFFGIIPPLLIDKNISQSLKAVRVIRLQLQLVTIKHFGD